MHAEMHVIMLLSRVSFNRMGPIPRSFLWEVRRKRYCFVLSLFFVFSIFSFGLFWVLFGIKLDVDRIVVLFRILLIL